MENENSKLTGIQKTAIFLITIGPELAAEIIKHLDEDEVEAITAQIANMKKIPKDTKKNVLQEFKNITENNRQLLYGGMDYARKILNKSVGEEEAVNIIEKVTEKYNFKPFKYTKKINPDLLFSAIENEHPQTIALILANIDSSKASKILKKFDKTQQLDIIKRMTSSNKISPQVIKDTNRLLEKKIKNLSLNLPIVDGIKTVVDILNQSDKGTEKQILASLEKTNFDLADKIKKHMFLFEDIIYVPDQSLQKLLRNLERSDIAKALKGTSDIIKEKIFRNVTNRNAALIKEEMEYIGPIRKQDVEEMQNHIVNIIRSYEESGEIIIERGNDDDVIIY